MEFREVYGMAFAQKRNDVLLTADDVTRQVREGRREIGREGEKGGEGGEGRSEVGGVLT